MNLATPHVVVARYPNAGIGDHISCLIGAWYYAKQTGRTLVIDWRGSRFNSDPTCAENCFHQLFDISEEFLDVPVISGDDVTDLEYDLPIFPNKWTPENLAATAHQPHTTDEISAINTLAHTGQNRQEPTVVFNQTIYPVPPYEQVRPFLKALKFAEPIRVAADKVWRDLIGDRPAIAIHIRHGNGENIGARAAYWLGPTDLHRQIKLNAAVDMHAPGTHGRFNDNTAESLIPATELQSSQMSFLRSVAKNIERMKVNAGFHNARPILFCDSKTVAEALPQIMPDIAIPPKTFIKSGDGPLHAISIEDGAAKPIASQVTFDMMVELCLMRKCSALVCMQSNFSILSRIELEEGKIHILRPPLINRLIQKAAHHLP